VAVAIFVHGGFIGIVQSTHRRVFGYAFGHLLSDVAVPAIDQEAGNVHIKTVIVGFAECGKGIAGSSIGSRSCSSFDGI
jgi:hypothetical protein